MQHIHRSQFKQSTVFSKTNRWKGLRLEDQMDFFFGGGGVGFLNNFAQPDK